MRPIVKSSLKRWLCLHPAHSEHRPRFLKFSREALEEVSNSGYTNRFPYYYMLVY